MEPDAVTNPSTLDSRSDLAAALDATASDSPDEIVAWAAKSYGDGLVLTSSFGAQSAVMLHLVTRHVPNIPVLWIDTGFNFPETYQFAETLTQRLALNLKVYQSPISPARMVALHGRLWEKGVEGLDVYDQIRKVEPRDRAFSELATSAWLSGVRHNQTKFRSTLHKAELFGNILKLHPILGWTAKQVHAYLETHGLPLHPLVAKGYTSIGDWHSTLSVGTDLDDRGGRFLGLKQECGLHVPQSMAENESRDASGL